MPKPILVPVVEDERFFRQSMRRLMRSWVTASRRSRRHPISSPHLSETACLIADVQMPSMTGPELHRYLIASGYEIPTIILTAYANDCVRTRALKDGVVCYLQKPVDEKRLLGCFEAALQSREWTEDNS